MNRLKVLSVASEIYPLIKTGGLADVAGALPKALAAGGVNVQTLVPGYPAVLDALEEAQEITVFPALFGMARLLAGKSHGLNLFVLDAPYLYGRPGNPYVGPDGLDWPDNAYRFGALAKVAAEIGLGMVQGFVPDIVHMHDWQAGLTAAYIHYSGRAAPGMVMTVHNLAFQGQFPAELVLPLGLPPSSFAWDGIEHYGSIGFLKAGLQLADRITTVSPTYAKEIMEPENGMGFEGLLRARAGNVTGILNGIDTAVWDPAKDPMLTKPFDASHLEARAANKAFLRSQMRLNQEAGALLVGVVSRLSLQKGLDILVEALPRLVGEGIQFAILGSGEPELEAKFLAAAEAFPGRVGVKTGLDETVAHHIQAGSDVMLVPSRFEPCGLTQLVALRYGAVPVVTRVGGLCDTVVDANEMALAAGVATGIQFYPATAGSLSLALDRAARLFRNRPVWQTMQKNGMATDVSWRGPASRYAKLYLELYRSKHGAGASTGEWDNVVSFEPAGSSRVEGKAATATIRGTGAGAVSVSFGDEEDEPASVEAAGAGAEQAGTTEDIGEGVASPGPEGATDKAAPAVIAEAEAVAAGAEAGQGGMAVGIGEDEASAGSGGAADEAAPAVIASAEAGQAGEGKGGGGEAASASCDDAKDRPASAETDNSQAERDEIVEGGGTGMAPTEGSGFKAGEDEAAIAEPPGSGSEMDKAAAAGAEVPEGEADTVASIACRDA